MGSSFLQPVSIITAPVTAADMHSFAVLINFTLPLMLKVWSVRAAWFFVCLGIPGTVLAFFIMPESKNRSSAEIQEMFVDHVPLRKWRGYKTAVERDMEARMQQSGL
jgi:SP family general alpha glucoside:H+ symporter-like MFS transporter